MSSTHTPRCRELQELVDTAGLRVATLMHTEPFDREAFAAADAVRAEIQALWVKERAVCLATAVENSQARIAG